jgi:hypothetical protein
MITCPKPIVSGISDLTANLRWRVDESDAVAFEGHSKLGVLGETDSRDERPGAGTARSDDQTCETKTMPSPSATDVRTLTFAF